MSNKKRAVMFIRIMIYIILIAFIIWQIFVERQLHKLCINDLRSKIENLKMDQISNICVLPGHIIDKTAKNNMVVFSGHKRDIIVNMIQNFDETNIGGHSKTIYECIIKITFIQGKEQYFLGSVYSTYDFNKNALYISNNFYERIDHGYKMKYAQYCAVRIPELGTWLINEVLADGTGKN